MLHKHKPVSYKYKNNYRYASLCNNYVYKFRRAKGGLTLSTSASVRPPLLVAV